MIDRDLEATVRRLFFAEHWKKGTISAQLGLHPDVVDRVIGQLGPSPANRPPMPTMLDPYKLFIEETLEHYPKLRSTRIYDMIVDRGYTGSQRTLTRFVGMVRPAPKSEVFLRNEPLPGEQSQIDWGHVGSVLVPGGSRPLWVFVMTLAFSRAIFAELVFDLDIHSLRRSLLHASLFFGGVTRQWLFDNPKTVVLERQGDLVHFQPDLLSLTAALNVQPRLCGVRKPHHKGGVERAVRYLKERFFAARLIHSIEYGNVELRHFLIEIALERFHPVYQERRVAEVLDEERNRLLILPDSLPCAEQVTPVSVDKTATVRFDCNRYSVPPKHARSTLTLVASDKEVRMLDAGVVVATHPRCWGKGQSIDDPEHRRAVLDTKPAACDGSGRKRLLAVAPRMRELLEHWLLDGRNLGSLVARTLKLLDLYGERVFAQAVETLLERGGHDFGALSILCDQLRRPAQPMIPLTIGDHVIDHDVVPHDLGGYDD